MFLLSHTLSISDPIGLRLRVRVTNPITIRVSMYGCCTVAKHMFFCPFLLGGTIYPPSLVA